MHYKKVQKKLAHTSHVYYNSYKLNGKGSLKMQPVKTQKAANKKSKAVAFDAAKCYAVCKLTAKLYSLTVTLTLIAALLLMRNVAQN